ncbi:MAG: Holliday junction branch migration protein RuvA [Bacteroidia bacterium]|nr:Holliday junction branch migration protein RuvA [Bacteroidia bacterium]
MYDNISGKIVELGPSHLVLECSGIGYFINISLHSYSALANKPDAKLYIHQIIREDAHLLFGFAEKKERELFRYLISVSGIGAATARMMLSALSPEEINSAIISQNVGLLKSIKGIGSKTAERVIVELKDKLGKIETGREFYMYQDNTVKNEALSALVMLGFAKGQVEKVIGKIISENNQITIEDLVKEALKRL